MTPAILLFIFIVTMCGSVLSYLIIQGFWRARSVDIFDEEDAIGLLVLAMTGWGWFILITHFPRVTIGG